MAIQHFVDGYFTGKVGAYVGAKWKNLKTLRSLGSWDVSKAPHILRQRMTWKYGIKIAKWCQNINIDSYIWQSPKQTNWNTLTTSCYYNYKKTLNPYMSMCVRPNAYTNIISIRISFMENGEDNLRVAFTTEETTLALPRFYIIATPVVDKRQNELQMGFFKFKIENWGEYYKLPIGDLGYAIFEHSYICGASSDDIELEKPAMCTDVYQVDFTNATITGEPTLTPF